MGGSFIYYADFILTRTILFLIVRLFLIKKEMKRITREMKNNPDDRSVNVDFVDEDLRKITVEINYLYDKFMRVRAQNKENEKRIKESVSMISHDMRTPLTSVIGYLQVAEKSDNPEEVQHNIEIALERAKYLNKLVNDFFEISLIESGKIDIKMEKVNLSEVICEEILAESPLIDKKGIEPVFAQAESDIFVNADIKKLSRIIQNLVSNAVKYSVKRLDFNIDASGDKVNLSIITDATQKIDVDKIFDRFYQEDSSRTKGGAGLGLYICKEFAQRMNGSIRARQADDEFEIVLTLEKYGGSVYTWDEAKD